MYGPILGLLNSKIRNVSLNFEIKELCTFICLQLYNLYTNVGNYLKKIIFENPHINQDKCDTEL